MTTRPTQLDGASRNTQTAGSATIRLPFPTLVRQFISWFALETLDHLRAGPKPDFERLFVQCEIDETTLDLSEFFDGIDGGIDPARFQFTRNYLLQNARLAEDLADNHGAWQDLDLDVIAEEAIVEICKKIEDCVESVAERSGVANAAKTLTEIRDRFAKQRDRTRGEDDRWTSLDKEQLDECARQLRLAPKPKRGVVGRLLQWIPQVPLAWYSPADPARLKAKVLPQLAELADLRVSKVVREAKLSVYDHLLGTGGGDRGKLGSLADNLATRRAEAERTADIIAASAPQPVAGNDLYIARHIDDLFDIENNISLRTIYAETVRRCGCTPRKLAEHLHHEGIVIDGIRYQPGNLHGVDPKRRAAALRRKVCRYLGYRGRKTKVNLDRPRTALDAIAAITPTHALLRPALERLLPDFEWRSRPYGEFQNVKDVAPESHAFLYCHPDGRHVFEKLIQTPLANRSEGDTDVSQQYKLSHPYAAILVQVALAGPGGAQLDLQRAMRQKARLRGLNSRQPMFRDDYPEVRLLAYRADDYDDAVTLFDAAAKSHVVVALAGGAFNLLKKEHGLEHLFAPHRFVPQWRTAEFFAELLNNGRTFYDFVQAAFPSLTEWPAIVQELQLFVDAESVAEKLVDVSVLEANPHKLYRVCSTRPPRNLPVPPGLYSVANSSLVGLKRDEFISLLAKNDWLYNVLFWQVADALDQQRITPADVSSFMVTYLQRLDQAA